MKWNRIASAVLAAAMVWAGAGVASPAMGQTENSSGQAQLVVTANGNRSSSRAGLRQGDIAVKLRNRTADIAGWTPLQGADDVQLIFLFDESARSYLSQQIPSLTRFIEALPPSADVGIAYMGNGRAIMAGPMTTDHTRAASYMRITNGIPGISGSPYFCLSDLAKHWPSKEKTARRVVFMVTDGQDPYYGSRDLQDPYVAAAIQDSQKANLLVYSIYFANRGFQDRGFGARGSFRILTGQSYLQRVADETGGEFYSLALTSPVSFDPFLQQFHESLDHQYLLTLAVGHTGWQQISVKSKVSGVKLAAPRAIYIDKNKQ